MHALVAFPSDGKNQFKRALNRHCSPLLMTCRGRLWQLNRPQQEVDKPGSETNRRVGRDIGRQIGVVSPWWWLTQGLWYTLEHMGDKKQLGLQNKCQKSLRLKNLFSNEFAKWLTFAVYGTCASDQILVHFTFWETRMQSLWLLHLSPKDLWVFILLSPLWICDPINISIPLVARCWSSL